MNEALTKHLKISQLPASFGLRMIREVSLPCCVVLVMVGI